MEKNQDKKGDQREGCASYFYFFSCATRAVRPSERASAGAFSVVRPSLAADVKEPPTTLSIEHRQRQLCPLIGLTQQIVLLSPIVCPFLEPKCDPRYFSGGGGEADVTGACLSLRVSAPCSRQRWPGPDPDPGPSPDPDPGPSLDPDPGPGPGPARRCSTRVDLRCSALLCAALDLRCSALL